MKNINSINLLFLNSLWPLILTFNIIRISMNTIMNINKTILIKSNLILGTNSYNLFTIKIYNVLGKSWK